MPHPSDRCPACGVTYRAFRCGFAFGAAAKGSVAAPNSAKAGAWAAHLDACDAWSLDLVTFGGSMKVSISMDDGGWTGEAVSVDAAVRYYTQGWAYPCDSLDDLVSRVDVDDGQWLIVHADGDRVAWCTEYAYQVGRGEDEC